MSNFKNYYCRFGGFSGNEVIGFKNIDTLKYHLEKCSLRRTKDILNLPPKTVITETLEMSDTQATFYENITQGILDQVDKVKIRNNANLLSLVTRLRQATACPSILTTENIPSVKIDRAVDLTEQLISNGEKVVIFSTFKDTTAMLQQRLSRFKPLVITGNNDDDELERAKFLFQNDEEYPLFIGTWQKCGTGITLNRASYMIFIDTPWTAAVFEQAQDRIHRIGTRSNVFIYNLVTTNTIDERVKEIVDDKESLSNYIIDDEITEKGLESLRKYIESLY
jgi:SNF2 family DNA or RNA helicase